MATQAIGESTPWERLRGCLRQASANGFAEVMRPGLGTELVRLVSACLEPGSPAELRRYCARLESFDGLGKHDRSVLVAQGTRLCLSFGPRGESPKPNPRFEAAAKRRTAAAATVAAPLESAPAVDWTPAAVSELKGVGKTTVAKLRAKGIETIADLLLFLPSGYQDFRDPPALDALKDGDVAVLEAEVRGLRQGFARGRFMATMQLQVADHTVLARWFHRVGGLADWAKGGSVIAVGPIRHYKGQITMAHPELHAPGDERPAIGVKYPAIGGLAARTVTRLIGKALERLDDPAIGLIDAVPLKIASAQGLPSKVQALRDLHRPAEDLSAQALASLQSTSSASHRRLAFEEFFMIQMAVLHARGRLQRLPSMLTVPTGGFSAERLRACLPFEPTAAQWRVLAEIERDMADGPPMLRLLQGDVGSGKTAVAFAAALAVSDTGGQVALMAPTEILAHQHQRTLAPWCEQAGLRVAILTGATPKAQRASMIALLAAGSIDLLIGTHALLVDDVQFRELGLVIVDEQHRFGVEQRALMRSKGRMPHLLVMTATPIPRTVALCAYGELEVSVIDELPPGRQPVETTLHTGKRGLTAARNALKRRIKLGEQAFVVCPLVEASEALDVTDVEATAAAVAALVPDVEVGVVHGRMTSADKTATMNRFRAGELGVLVATTVIEVGVDVPAAKVMLVEHAERFGLAQLHQLRGRVGRGQGQSRCILHTVATPSSDSVARLKILTETGDGFVVAQRDLALRGPGEVFGTRQAGAPKLRFAGLAPDATRLLVAARDAAAEVLEADPELRDHPTLARLLAQRVAQAPIFTADSG